jgi:hypothetical protein
MILAILILIFSSASCFSYGKTEENYIYDQINEAIDFDTGRFKTNFRDGEVCERYLRHIRQIEFPVLMPDGKSVAIRLGEAFSQQNSSGSNSQPGEYGGIVGNSLKSLRPAFFYGNFNNQVSSNNVLKMEMQNELSQLKREFNQQQSLNHNLNNFHDTMLDRPNQTPRALGRNPYSARASDFSPAQYNSFLQRFSIKLHRFIDKFGGSMSAQEMESINKSLYNADKMLRLNGNANVKASRVAQASSYVKSATTKLFSIEKMGNSIGESVVKPVVGGGPNLAKIQELKMKIATNPRAGFSANTFAGNVLALATVGNALWEATKVTAVKLSGAEAYTSDAMLFNNDIKPETICRAILPSRLANNDPNFPLWPARLVVQKKVQAVMQYSKISAQRSQAQEDSAPGFTLYTDGSK